MKKVWIVLIGILLLAAVLRFWQLGNVPASPDWDEAALGYNAYSILHTGRDEYGKFLPLILRSFDDYKPGLYAYLVIPVIALFDLSVWATRFPAAFFGVLTVLGTFFLVKKLLKNEKIALLAAFFLAVSPWHIQFSHAAFEASVGVTCNVFAALFFLKAFKRHWFLFLSVLCSAASIYVYQSEKVFAPLFFLLLVLVYRKDIFQLPKKFIAAAVIFGLILMIPMVSYTVTNKAVFARAQGVSFLADSNQLLQTDVKRLQVDRNNHDIIGLFYDNRRLVFLKQAIANYLSHFDPNWLFVTGDIPRHHAPGMGIIYLWEVPFLLIGLYLLIFGNFLKKSKYFIFLWFLIVPIPAAVTTGVPHAIRTINFLPVFQIFSAIGVLAALNFCREKVKNTPVRFGIYTIVMLLFLFNFSYYLNQYFVQQNYFNSDQWQYGYALAVPKVAAMENKYKKIVVSNKPYLDQSYMFFLFYLKYSPQEYQNQSLHASGGFREDHSFGKYEFRPIVWDKEQKTPDILYVGQPSDFPPGVHVIDMVDFLDGRPDMWIVEG